MLACCLAPAVALAQEKPAAAQPAGPLSPEGSMATMRLPSDVTVELAACEPEVVDPVEIRFDEQGRMWVVQMSDYPHGPPQGQPGACQIRVLEDTNGDGRYEKATVFADKLLFATGVQPWRGGVIVTLAGEVTYMKDTNGDGQADLTETWYTGFAQQNSQLRANHPRLAQDGWVYVANGLRNGSIVDPRRPEQKPISINGMDFRFDPRGGQCEAVTGNGQFGLTFDDYGNRFVCSNRNPLKHVVIEDRYLKRNPQLAITSAVHDVAAWGDDSHIYPISRAWTTSTLHAGQFTAACGVHIYRGDELPERYRGAAFVCDPTGNLVHCEIMSPDGATFQSKPLSQKSEFLASTDEWFRPVNLETGPDGALYVVDMYRAVIEHPEFVPDELKNRPDLRHGDDRGRVYRLKRRIEGPTVPYRSAGFPYDLSKLKPEELKHLVALPKAWQAEHVAMYILENERTDCVDALNAVALEREANSIVAISVLKSLGKLSDATILEALSAKMPRVRETAVRLGEDRLNGSAELRKRTIALFADNDARVRFQVALSLGEVKDEKARAEIDVALAGIALRGADDAWMRTAVMTSASGRAANLLDLVIEKLVAASDGSLVGGKLALVRELAQLAGHSKDPAQVRLALFALSRMSSSDGGQRVQRSGLLGMAAALRRSGTSLETAIAPLGASQFAALNSAPRLATDEKQPEAVRRETVELLGHLAGRGEVLLQIAQRDAVVGVRLAAIAALSGQPDKKPWQELLSRLPGESPAIRRAVLDAVLTRPERTALLLDEIESGRMKASELDRAHVNLLLGRGPAEQKARAAKLLEDAIPGDRKQVLADYQAALTLTGDARRGREVFKKTCVACHRVADLGVNVAPDIADSRTKTPAQLLTDILQPNRAIDANYVSYIIRTGDGRSLTGILAAETGASVTLRQQEGKTVMLLRSEIEAMQTSGVSLMPEGLEKDISPQAMADLLSFLKNWRYLDGKTPLGK
ncbi:MAG: c-type cytochrome [Planctomycetia bacterium]|nr:c-type cytochrome [Planctomycetia bacterium]